MPILLRQSSYELRLIAGEKLLDQLDEVIHHLFVVEDGEHHRQLDVVENSRQEHRQHRLDLRHVDSTSQKGVHGLRLRTARRAHHDRAVGVELLSICRRRILSGPLAQSVLDHPRLQVLLVGLAVRDNEVTFLGS